MAEFLQALAIQNSIALRDDLFQQCFLEGTELAAGFFVCFLFCLVFFNHASKIMIRMHLYI